MLTEFFLLDNYVDLFAWTLVDLTCGIIAANLPTMNVIIPRSRKDVYKAFSYLSSTKQGSSKTGGSKPSFRGGQKPNSDNDTVPRSVSDDSQVETLYHADDVELLSSQTKASDESKFPYTVITEH